MKKILFILTLTTFFSCKSQKMLIEATPGNEYILPKVNKNIKIILSGKGSKEKPFTLKGQKGSSEILGGSYIVLTPGTSHVIIKDLLFKNNNIKYQNSTALIEIGKTKNSKIENILIDNIKIKNTKKFKDNDVATQFHWININATDVTVTNSEFVNKQNRLPIIHIGSNYEGIKIINSVFSDVSEREGEALEAIRIGLTEGNSNALISNNIFRNYFGDSETISVKANGPQIVDNTFINSRSGVSIRYADNVIIKDNLFNNVAHAVRISGKEHIIENNSFYNTKSRYITFMGGGKNYPRAENIIIRNNNFQDKFILYVIDHTINILPPKNITFENNYINGILLENKIKNFEKKRKLIKNSSGIKSYQVEY